MTHREMPSRALSRRTAGHPRSAYASRMADTGLEGVIALARVYDPPPSGGRVFFVERLWPRGMRRDAIHIDAWLKDAAPSTALRQWFGHDPQKWAEFRKRYFDELDANPDAWRPIVAEDPVTLLFSSRDREHNSAVALRDYVLAHLP